MTTILVDSDVLIEVLRGRDTLLAARWRELAASETVVAYSPVAAAEIWAGARAPEKGSITALFSSMVCAPIDAEIGRRAGEYLQAFRKSHALEMSDALVAATAGVRNLHLWTRNRKHFPMKDVTFF